MVLQPKKLTIFKEVNECKVYMVHDLSAYTMYLPHYDVYKTVDCILQMLRLRLN